MVSHQLITLVTQCALAQPLPSSRGCKWVVLPAELHGSVCRGCELHVEGCARRSVLRPHRAARSAESRFYRRRPLLPWGCFLPQAPSRCRRVIPAVVQVLEVLSRGRGDHTCKYLGTVSFSECLAVTVRPD